MSISRKRQYQLMTEHGIYEKPDFTEVEALDDKTARIVFQGAKGANRAGRGIMRYFRLRIPPRASCRRITI